VIPPLWETPLFRWGLVLFLAVLAAGGFRLRVRGIARRNKQLERQVAERTREIEQRRRVAEGLRDVINLINANCPLEESLNLILNQVGQYFPSGKVYLVEHTGENRLEFLDLPISDNEVPQGETTPAQRRQMFADGAFPWLADLVHSNAARVISPITDLGDWPGQYLPGLPPGITSAVYIPVMPEGEIFGGFLLFLPAGKTPGQEDLELLSTFADQCALAIGNERLRDRAEESAVLAERSRLARELHDAVTQTLFSASLIAEALPSTWQADRDEGKLLLRELRQLNRAALAEMRSLLMELRPSVILESRLGDLLRQLAEAVIGRAQIDMNLDIQDPCRLPDDVHIALYRISQEALSNISRHSQASRIDLLLRCRKLRGQQYQVSLSIHDDGVGFNPRLKKAGHFGLLGLKERAASIGARLKVTSSPGKGTTIQVAWQGDLEGKHG
jgi:signal transduction histidine kinase